MKKNRFQKFLELSKDGLLVFKLISNSAQIIEFNPAFTEILGMESLKVSSLLPLNEFLYGIDIDREFNLLFNSTQPFSKLIYHPILLKWLEIHIDQDEFEDQYICILRDVTLEKKEDQLNQEIRNYNFITENSSLIFYRYNLNGKKGIHYISKNIEKALGYPISNFYKNPNFLCQIIHGEDRLILENFVLNRDEKYTLRWIKSDGSYLYLEHQNNMIFNEFGKPEAIEGIALDVTNQNLQNHELTESNYLYHEILKNYPNGFIYVLDKNHTILKAVGSDLGSHHQDPFSLIGKNISDCYPETESEILKKNFSEVFEGKSIAFEFPYNSRIVKIYGFPLIDINYEINQIIIIANDITKFKNIETSLKKSLIEISGIKNVLDRLSIVAVTDSRGIITYVNSKFCEISKYSPDELLGSSHRIVNSGFHPKEFFKHLWDTIKSGKIWRSEILNKAKDGTLYWVDTTIAPLFNEEGNINQFIAIRTLITERKRMEESLQKAHQFAKIGEWEYNISEDRLKCSDSILDLFNMERSEFESRYKNFLDLVHPEDRSFVQKNLNYSYTLKTPQQVEHRILLRNGEIRWVIESYYSEFSQNGEPTLTIGILQDISDRKITEMALKESNTKLLLVSINSPDYLIILNKNRSIEYINKAIPGINLYSVNGSDILHFIPRKSKKLVREWIDQALLDTSGFIKDLAFHVKEIGYQHFSIRFVPIIEANRITSLYIIATDITSQKKAELELQKTRKLLIQTNSIARVGGWSYEFSEEKLYLSRVSRSILNLSDEYEYTSAKIIESLFDKKSRYLLLRKVNTGLTNHNNFDIELKIDKGQKQQIWIKLTGRPEVSSGKPVLLIGAIQDITEKKINEIEILKRSKEALEANKAKSEFLARMSHELRTPLNGVIGFTELLLNTQLEKYQKDYVKNINLSANSLLDIINEILDYSKIEVGKLILDEIPTDIIQLLEQAIDIVKFSASKKKIEVLLEIDYRLPQFIIIDPIRLKQVIINLLSNAIKFTEKGDVKLSIIFEEGKSPGIGIFWFSVSDTGIGISNENQSRIFKVFSQADPSITRRFGGTGLGLVISKMLIEKMGGEIHLNSKPGKGSTFYFQLSKPFQRGKEMKLYGRESIRKILLADSNHKLLDILSDYFIANHIQFVPAENSVEVMRQFESHKDIDLILIAQKLSDVSGIDTLKRIQRLSPERFSKIKVMIMHDLLDESMFHIGGNPDNECLKIEKPLTYTKLMSSFKRLYSSEISETYEAITEEIIETNQKEGTIIKVMVVDDVEMNRMLLIDYLGAVLKGAQILEASNGVEAMEIFKKESLDLIFMDIQMPEKDGFQTTQEIREIEKQRGTSSKIIALTAGTFQGEKERSFHSGMNEFLTKPIQIKNLTLTLKNLGFLKN
ncbi:MAG: PAS domain S-box protein [Leptospiraceae bacterium]|nr:PAS domain S-box protein [Leptospiraceae bacterium]